MNKLILALFFTAAIGATNAVNDDNGISTDVTETFFYLYTAETGVENPVEGPKDVNSADGEAALAAGGFDPDRERTFLLIHGFWSDETWADKFVPGQ